MAKFQPLHNTEMPSTEAQPATSAYVDPSSSSQHVASFPAPGYPAPAMMPVGVVPQQMPPGPETMSAGRRYAQYEWSDSMTDFAADWNSCALATCPCSFPFRWSWTMTRSGIMSKQQSLIAMLIATGLFMIAFFIDPLIGFFFLIPVIALGVYGRGLLRDQYSIPRNTLQDVAAWICIPFAAAQEARHVDRSTDYIAPSVRQLQLQAQQQQANLESVMVEQSIQRSTQHPTTIPANPFAPNTASPYAPSNDTPPPYNN